jgi:preprotein translocase subunit YajC
MHMLYWPQEAAPPPAAAPPAAPTTTAPSGPQGAPAADPGGGGGMFGGLFVPLILMFVVMYFLMIRPQKKQQQQRDRMIANLKKDDHVLTNAGIYGIVKQVKDDHLVLAIDESKDVRIRVAKSAVAGLVKSSGAEDEKKAETPEKAKS